jgi:hypothetical protein
LPSDARSNLERYRPVDTEELDGGSSGRCLAHDREILTYLKMVRPAMRTRVEHARYLPCGRIAGFCASPFSEGARDAGQGQILQRGWPAVTPRVNVVDVERRFLAGLWNTAVFAVISGSNADAALE